MPGQSLDEAPDGVGLWSFRMRCRHTVPDWHRFVVSPAEARPIFAACRLLVREGEQAADSRGIACNYWGRQPDCPVYDGPGAWAVTLPVGQISPILRSASADIPVAGGEPWPVRPPGATDGFRRILIGLGVLSVALLAWTALVGLAVMRGASTPGRLVSVALLAAMVSIATHILTTLRAWARR